MRPLRVPIFFLSLFFCIPFRICCKSRAPVPVFVPLFLMRLNNSDLQHSLLLYLSLTLSPVMYVICKEPGQSFVPNESRKLIEKIVSLILKIKGVRGVILDSD